jgi:phthiocerol/phenolphthiocerol synthesis type-I polyketide synthase E
MNELYVPDSNHNSAIAIIGMSCRVPKAKNIDEFWQNLRDGVESISFFSAQELESEGIEPSLLNNPSYVKASSILSDIELFDASFFDFNPRKAEIMDPQHRLFLECAWDVLENAGYDSENYEGVIGVYAGVGMNTYLLNNLYPNRNLLESLGDFQVMIGNDKDFLTTCVSYKLNLKGPSINVQTACSTSLVAVHLACQSLLNGECDMALAGGVTVRVPEKAGYFYREGMIFSPDGHCRAFDARAQGTVGGSGVGIVVLKRLEDALVDGDSIHAVIKGSAINNDGLIKVDYTAPSVDGQAAVIAEAQAIAGVEAGKISYVETHGTGTSLGDPIEIAALTQAFGTTTDKKGFCAIGSVKTNVGHLDTAAGVVGLIKTVLALKHKLLPPSLHFEKPNPNIDFVNSPFYVNTNLSEWKTDGTPRRSGISSFGIGGTNAHVVLEEAPALELSGPSRPWQLIVLSAKTSSALDTATANLGKHLQQHLDLNLADVAYTLSQGRRAFSYRRMLLCQNQDEAAVTLSSLGLPQVFTNSREAGARPIAFMFSGQGTQYVNMALELYQTESVFRAQIDQCAEILKPLLGRDLRHVLYPGAERVAAATQQLQETEIAQPALFVLEYALAQLWMHWGVHPQTMIGHSIGEYVAACLAGVFSLEEALALVAARGQLMQQLPAGKMLAVPLPATEVQSLLSRALDLAAINGPSLCVVSGPTEAVELFQKQLAEQGIECRHLHTSHAFHSHMMEPILVPFAQWVKQVSLKPPQIPYLSNVTGTWITAAEVTSPEYWVRHLRETVHFAESLQQLLTDPERILLEVGPGQTLSTLAKRHPEKTSEQVVLSSVRCPQQSQSDVAFLLTTLGQLWLTGVDVNWTEFYAQEQRYRLPLPTYPFERQRYWIEPPKNNQQMHSFQASKPDATRNSLSHSLWEIERYPEVRQDQQLLPNGLRSPQEISDRLVPELDPLTDQYNIQYVVKPVSDRQSQNPNLQTSEVTECSEKSEKRDSSWLHSRPNLQNGYVAPRNQLEHTIADIWQKFLGIEPVGIEDDFFELGGDSLLAIQLISKLRETFQTNLSPGNFLNKPTIAVLAKSIEETISIAKLPNQKVRSVLPPSLIEIQPGSSLKKPLFLVHPADGHIYLFRDLVRHLGSDLPIYVFQYPGLEGEIEPFTRVEEMAAYYIKALRVLQPEGPYFLGGSSFGGCVAFEISQQLHSLDQKVAFLALMDTPGPDQISAQMVDKIVIPTDAGNSQSDNYSLSLEAFQHLGAEAQMTNALEQAKIVNRLFSEIERSQARQFLRVFKANLQALSNYVPRPYPGRITFFRAREQWMEFSPSHPELPWIDVAASGIEIHLVPGNHITMNFAPHVQFLAERLKNCIEKAQVEEGETVRMTI